jgi:hypothetical protein
MRILHIVRVDPTALQHLEYENPDVGWVYTNLVDHKKPSRAFLGDLLLVLIRYRRFRGQPPKDALHAIISALSPQSDINDPDEEHTQLTRRASVVLCSADHWFTDNNLRSQLMEDSVWLILSEQHLPKYTSLGVKLLQQQEWKAIIQKYPHCWLNQYPRIIGLKGHQGRVNNKYKKFQFVLSNLWEAQNAKAAQFVKEKTLVIVFMVLADAWKKVDSFNARATLSLLECTVEASFSVRVIELDVQYPSDPFIKEIISRLGNAVARAGERAIQVINKPNTDMDLEESAIQVINKPRADMDLEDKVHGVAKFLSDLAFVINGELKNPAEKYTDRDEEGKHWQRLRDTFRARMVVLRTT